MNEWASYEAGAECYASVGVDDPAWRERQRATFLRMRTGPVVADLGCGPGYDLAALAALGLTTVGIEALTGSSQIWSSLVRDCLLLSPR